VWGEPGGGSQFRLTLPCTAGETVHSSPLALQPADSRRRRAAAHGQHHGRSTVPAQARQTAARTPAKDTTKATARTQAKPQAGAQAKAATSTRTGAETAEAAGPRTTTQPPPAQPRPASTIAAPRGTSSRTTDEPTREDGED
jgi:two-component system sensor histidine kinase MtrB